jgi:hypothetical protein
MSYSFGIYGHFGEITGNQGGNVLFPFIMLLHLATPAIDALNAFKIGDDTIIRSLGLAAQHNSACREGGN